MHAYRDQYATLFKDGQNVVLIAISADPVDTLAAWARDDQFQFLFASDTGAAVGKLYGAFAAKYGLDNRSLFVVGRDGKVAYRQVPFREIDPTAYTELARGLEAILAR
jgi:peroxiredoxin